jgi:ribosomal protein L12E/L44/L45/RPP1/RPP2
MNLDAVGYAVLLLKGSNKTLSLENVRAILQTGGIYSEDEVILQFLRVVNSSPSYIDDIVKQVSHVPLGVVYHECKLTLLSNQKQP